MPQDPMDFDGYPRQRSVNASQEFPRRRSNNSETYSGEASHQKQRKPSRGSLATPGSRNVSQQYPLSQRDDIESAAFANQFPLAHDLQPVATPYNRRVQIPEDCESWFELWVNVNERISKEEFIITITDVTAIADVRKVQFEDYASVR